MEKDNQEAQSMINCDKVWQSMTDYNVNYTLWESKIEYGRLWESKLGIKKQTKECKNILNIIEYD